MAVTIRGEQRRAEFPLTKEQEILNLGGSALQRVEEKGQANAGCGRNVEGREVPVR
jgi:hypothetical protein